MPNDYYVSQYSGEEIDALLGSAGAGAGAVRYDAAQTLTDEQKAQARTNIGADTVQGAVLYTPQSLTDEQKAQAKGNISALNGQVLYVTSAGGQIGWYRITEPFSDFNTSGYLTVSHAWANGGPSELLLGVSSSPVTHGQLQCLRSAGQANSVPYISNARLVKIAETYVLDLYVSGTGINDWNLQLCNCGHNPITLTTPTFISADDTLPDGETLVAVMEYQNPPMLLGVEYKTAERYLGKPVYAQIVNFGTLPNGSTKRLNHNIQNISSVIAVYGQSQDQALTVGAFSGGITAINADNTQIIITTSQNISAYGAYVAVKYTKTTD